MASKQYKQIGCQDVAPGKGCAFEVRAETEDELLRHVAQHAKDFHSMDKVPPEMASKIKGAIRSVSVKI